MKVIQVEIPLLVMFMTMLSYYIVVEFLIQKEIAVVKAQYMVKVVVAESKYSSDRGLGQNRGHGQSRGRGQSKGCGQNKGLDQNSRGQDQSTGGCGQSTGEHGQNRGHSQSRGCKTNEDEGMQWTDSPEIDNGPAYFSFSGDLPGPLEGARGVKDPLSCFNLYIGDFFVELLRQSNLYANQQQTSRGDSRQFTSFDMEEMLAFIGVNIAMGIVSLPSLEDYWMTDIVYSHPWFGTIMSRDRFRTILRYIHVADNSQAPKHDDPGYDKLWKVHPLLNFVAEKCARLYAPHPQLSIDESMIGTKCRLSFIQYMLKKPVKWGYQDMGMC